MFGANLLPGGIADSPVGVCTGSAGLKNKPLARQKPIPVAYSQGLTLLPEAADHRGISLLSDSYADIS